MEICVKDNELENVAALKVAMKGLAEKYGCQAIAIQCWNQLQCELGIMPCAANSLLNEEGIPVVCETDIHGAITALLVEAAGMGETRSLSLIHIYLKTHALPVSLTAACASGHLSETVDHTGGPYSPPFSGFWIVCI